MNFREHELKLEQNEAYKKANADLKIHFEIANAVYKARVQKGLSQAQLAKQIGTKQANISRIEAGLGNPTLRLIQKLAQVLDFHVDLTVDLVPASIVQFIEASNSFRKLDHPLFVTAIKSQSNEESCYPKITINSPCSVSNEAVPCN